MPPKRTFIQPGQKLELDLTPVERKAILDGVTLLPDEYDRLLKKIHPEQPLLLTLDELEDFSGYVAAESNHTKNKKLRAVLDSAYGKMSVLLDSFTNHKPPASKTTKKALAAEREKAERQKKISEQAAFLATWAAGVLQAADQIGHHVQNQLGISNKVQSMRQRLSDRDYNKLSVRMELQADFLAGVWAHHVARYAGILDEEDIREAVNAAAAIGDDRIQKQSQGYVVPDAFTHGTSEQRVRWFLYGLKTGNPELMDRAFEVDEP
jgi:hypothetical protein